MNDQKQKKQIADTLDNAKGEADDLIRLSTGVVLRAKQANPTVLIQAMSRVKRPTPPTYFNEAMGRDMENQDDPDYVSRVQAWQMEYSSNMLIVLVALGTDLFSKPKEMSGPTDDEWLQDYKLLGFEVYPSSKSWRYFTWVLYKAAVNSDDTNLIMNKVKGFSGVKEADVRDAENFPGRDEAGR